MSNIILGPRDEMAFRHDIVGSPKEQCNFDVTDLILQWLFSLKALGSDVTWWEKEVWKPQIITPIYGVEGI